MTFCRKGLFMQENHRNMAALELPSVTVKLEDEEAAPWLPNNQGSEDTDNFPSTHSAGFPVPKSEVIHGGDPWIPEPVSEEREIPTDYTSELPDVIVKLEEEEELYIPYRQVSAASTPFKGPHSVSLSRDQMKADIQIPRDWVTEIDAIIHTTSVGDWTGQLDNVTSRWWQELVKSNVIAREQMKFMTE
ncbi:hypothetical protein JRQ81_012335 [Phrynocephalus forsythii]|uniref:Uncharacterized protein n=1 Tax=Phrynocephalus forsythii TaxID=171643 RepID=A0A9Q1APX6_9SAUR|nr:hypothetical protein JRQ81_012335 [Phrynocephalus forsythii]